MNSEDTGTADWASTLKRFQLALLAARTQQRNDIVGELKLLAESAAATAVNRSSSQDGPLASE
jgi:hypothetical protein